MTPVITKILKMFGVFVLALLAIIAGAIYWLHRTEETCWKHEASEAFEKYDSLKTRTEILKGVDIQNDLRSKDTKSNPLEIIEKDPNGCSFGSNGKKVLKCSIWTPPHNHAFQRTRKSGAPLKANVRPLQRQWGFSGTRYLRDSSRG